MHEVLWRVIPRKDTMIAMRKRPLGITILALLFMWIGFLGTPVFFLQLVAAGIGADIQNVLQQRIHSPIVATVLTVLICIIWQGAYIAYAILGRGLWKVRPWARIWLIRLHLFAIVFAVLSGLLLQHWLPHGFAICGTLVLPLIVVLWYLKSARVKQAFESNPAALHPAGHPQGLWKRRAAFVAAGLICFLIFFAAVWFTADRMMHNARITHLAVERAVKFPCALRSLGAPLKIEGTITGNLTESETNGTAYIDIPVTGPKGKGELHVEAKQRGNDWTYHLLRLETSGEIIPLIVDDQVICQK